MYDVTEFQIDHPGGPDVLQDIAGQDASEEFENMLHTEKARKMAKKYLIGKLRSVVLGDLFPANSDGNTDVDQEEGDQVGSGQGSGSFPSGNNKVLGSKKFHEKYAIHITVGIVLTGISLTWWLKGYTEKKKKSIASGKNKTKES